MLEARRQLYSKEQREQNILENIDIAILEGFSHLAIVQIVDANFDEET
jgi:hypothetical protein